MNSQSLSTKSSRYARDDGYTLTEVLLAMAVMAVVLPLMMGLVLAGGESSRQAERETRAVITARAVYEELRRAANDNSSLVARDEIPWGVDSSGIDSGAAFGASGSLGGSGGGDDETSDGWLIFEVNEEGDLLGLAEGMKYDDRWEGTEGSVASVAAVRRFGQEVENVELSNGEPLRVFRLEVRVESPARAKAVNRDRTVFTKSESFR